LAVVLSVILKETGSAVRGIATVSKENPT